MENHSLIEAMEGYFKAGVSMDLERMEEIYASDFANIRTDKMGQSVTITKEQFMQTFRRIKEQGGTLGTTEDVSYAATTTFDNMGTVVLRREKEGKPVIYNFVWRMEGGLPKELVREFSYEEDLTALIAIIKAHS